MDAGHIGITACRVCLAHDAACRSGNDPGKRFLCALSADQRLVLVQMASLESAKYVDRSKDITPKRQFTEALMRALVQHFLAEYNRTTHAAAPTAGVLERSFCIPTLLQAASPLQPRFASPTASSKLTKLPLIQEHSITNSHSATHQLSCLIVQVSKRKLASLWQRAQQGTQHISSEQGMPLQCQPQSGHKQSVVSCTLLPTHRERMCPSRETV